MQAEIEGMLQSQAEAKQFEKDKERM